MSIDGYVLYLFYFRQIRGPFFTILCLQVWMRFSVVYMVKHTYRIIYLCHELSEIYMPQKELWCNKLNCCLYVPLTINNLQQHMSMSGIICYLLVLKCLYTLYFLTCFNVSRLPIYMACIHFICVLRVVLPMVCSFWIRTLKVIITKM